ncbi:hypothetical protein GUJ93_ZPchr0002g24835 [Zizania palustris]|uniref:Uncharacterized protein n=1 Tax=Zizania palustris TaxID=103762 RepID=A0A8J5SCP8_ZIZPA|nr:hypothetical protein GUJ93_ZPchr0002g24835 [Zizania palustris]
MPKLRSFTSRLAKSKGAKVEGLWALSMEVSSLRVEVTKIGEIETSISDGRSYRTPSAGGRGRGTLVWAAEVDELRVRVAEVEGLWAQIDEAESIKAQRIKLDMTISPERGAEGVASEGRGGVIPVVMGMTLVTFASI